MLAGEHSRNNIFSDSVFKKKRKKKNPFSTLSSPHILCAGAQQNTTDHKVCIWAVSHLSINKNVLKMCDQYAIGITHSVSRGLFVGCLTSQQHAGVSQGRVCSDNFKCCHTETDVADQTFHLTHSQYTDTGPTSPSTDPIIPGA